MINCAYDEMYLPLAQRVMGDMYDYAVNTLGMELDSFHEMFIMSGVSHQIEIGNPTYVAGKNGCEIAREVIETCTDKRIDTEDIMYIDKSREYWIGWAVAYYQWYSSRSYREIFKALSFEDLQNMYYTLHEADISKFVDIVDERIRNYFKDTNLKRIRNAYGCTQAALAKQAGVSLRSIQMYEQRQKDINKASADTLYRIAKVLGCNIEDLIEK